MVDFTMALLQYIVSRTILKIWNSSVVLNRSVKNEGYDGASVVNVNDVVTAISKLKSGKRDGSLGLCTDHSLTLAVSLLFSAMVLHGIASCLLYTSPSPRDS